MPSRNSTGWMWAQACDILEQAERLHRQFFHLSDSRHAHPVWEPPVDVLEDDLEIVVIVALPGASAEHVEVVIDGQALLVRAETEIAFGSSNAEIRRLEIPYGYFERRIDLPALPLEGATREFVNGCLIIKLRKAR
jgi:HSP20 family molecular chaperone IbpA